MELIEKKTKRKRKEKKKAVTDWRVYVTNCQQIGANNPSTLRLFEQDKEGETRNQTPADYREDGLRGVGTASRLRVGVCNGRGVASAS